MTEIVYAFGLGDQLERRTSDCDYRPSRSRSRSSPRADSPRTRPLGGIADAVRAATLGETPLYRLDEARIAQIQPDPISPRTCVGSVRCRPATLTETVTAGFTTLRAAR